MNIDWKTLEPELSRPLLQGGVGQVHLLGIANTALTLAVQGGERARAEELFQLGGDALLAAWEHACLDASTAGQVTALHAAYPTRFRLAPQILAVLAAVRDSAHQPANLEYLRRLLRRRETEKLFRYLESQRTEGPSEEVLFWSSQAMMVGLYEGEFDRAREWLLADVRMPQPLRARYLGDVAFARGAYADAAEAYAESLSGLPLAGTMVRRATALDRIGEYHEARAMWRSAARIRPWCVNTLLRLYDAETGMDRETCLPEGQGAVLLYTWNKAAYLDLALQSMAESDIGATRLIVLNNGSTDDTAGVLDKWREHLGTGRMAVETLPVNVGAPAARNWLMGLPALDDCRWVAYLDDDAIVPSDWLGRFGAAMRAYPQAWVWGCKVVNHDNPTVFQAVDLHLEEGGEMIVPQGVEPYHRRFGVSDLHHQELDFGWFDYVRPCVSVTGCAHLFLRDSLRRHGGFDLRFSPSQYDDLEHDLRGALQKTLPVYTGHLRVRHMKRTGRATRTDSGQMSNAQGNMYKLQLKYTAEEFAAMRRHDEAAAQADLLAKLSRIAE